MDGAIFSTVLQNLLGEFRDEKEPWLLTGIPNRDPIFCEQYWERHSVSSDHYMKKLMSLREGLHVRCNATCDSTLLIVVGIMNILEDANRGENLR